GGEGLAQRVPLMRRERGTEGLAADEHGRSEPPGLAHDRDALAQEVGPGRGEVAAAGEEQRPAAEARGELRWARAMSRPAPPAGGRTIAVEQRRRADDHLLQAVQSRAQRREAGEQDGLVAEVSDRR